MAQLLINEPPLQVLPSLARIVGLNEAIVLQQVHYWLNPHFNANYFDGRHWVHNTFAQWQQQFSFWSHKTIKRTIANLEASGLLVSFVTRTFKKTKYYTLDYGLLERIHPNEPDTPFLPKTTPDEPEQEGGEGEASPSPKSQQNQGFRPSGQSGPIEGDTLASSAGPMCPSREGQVDPLGKNKGILPMKIPPEPALKVKENQGIRPSGQVDTIEEDNLPPSTGPLCPDRWGQPGPLERVNVTPFHYTEITYPEITKAIDPLPPPSSAREDFGEAQEEEEEGQNKNINMPTANGEVYDLMVRIWNDTVQRKIHSGQVVHLTERRRQLLGHFLETVLRDRERIFSDPDSGLPDPGGYSALDAWRDYCQRIAQSRFLAGENPSGFRITLDWALLPEKAFKILEGAIYDKPVPPRHSPPDTPSWEAFVEGLANTVPPGPWHSPWLGVSRRLAGKLGQLRYTTWFSKTHLAGVAGTTATLQTTGRFVRDYIEANFRFDLLEAIQAAYPEVNYLDFQVAPAEGGTA